MKTDGAITIFRLMITFLLVAITSSGVVLGENEEVYDSTWEPVQADAPYLVEVHNLQKRASITRYGRKRHKAFSCLHRVVSIFDEIIHPPRPIIFVLSSDVVRVSTDLSIKFIMPSHCGESDFWRVPDSSLLVKEVVPSGSMSSNDSTSPSRNLTYFTSLLSVMVTNQWILV